MVLQRLKEAAEKAKIELLQHHGDGDQPALPHRRSDRAKHLVKRLTRAKFEQNVRGPVPARAGSDQEVPGRREERAPRRSTRSSWWAARRALPKLQQIVKDFFAKEPNRSGQPRRGVAIGAAVQGGRPHRRGEGHPAPRTSLADALHRDAGRVRAGPRS